MNDKKSFKIIESSKLQIKISDSNFKKISPKKIYSIQINIYFSDYLN